MPVPIVKLTAVHVLGLAAFGVAMGEWLKRRVPLLDAVHIPAPIIGGLVYACAIFFLREREVVVFDLDVVLQSILMVAFFTTIGLGASFRLIREGGVAVMILLLLATIGAALQNALGIGLVMLAGQNPLLGIITGATALAGGPATALAFGPTFEEMGLGAATAAGLAAAMYGIIAAGLFSGPLGALLIRRYKLAPPAGNQTIDSARTEPLDAGKLMNHILAIAVAMAIGSVISSALRNAGIVLPGYIGAMIVAAVIRNIDDRTGWLQLSQPCISATGKIALYLFIVMALIALDIWKLAALALPVLVILLFQTAMTLGFCYWLPIRLLGRNYEAAVMAGGFCGFMLGITANAVASMDEITRKHGPAPKAFLAVPVTGAFLIDFTNALLITVMANLVK